MHSSSFLHLFLSNGFTILLHDIPFSKPKLSAEDCSFDLLLKLRTVRPLSFHFPQDWPSPKVYYMTYAGQILADTCSLNILLIALWACADSCSSFYCRLFGIINIFVITKTSSFLPFFNFDIENLSKFLF